MKTLSVQQMPNGYELEVPTIGYWIKAGIGLMIGFMIMGAVMAFTWFVLVVGTLASLGRVVSHR
jgi:hypothetical protein